MKFEAKYELGMQCESITFIFSGLKIGNIFKSNTWLLILDPEVLNSLINKINDDFSVIISGSY